MIKRATTSRREPASQVAAPAVYPFTAIVAQEELKLALLLNVIAPTVGGVLIMGQRGTGKSTAVRALAQLLPPLARVKSCAYNCDPSDAARLCQECSARLATGEQLSKERAAAPVVELPLNATEDRVCGTINLERALKDGVKTFEPGLLARANRGFLYIDEVNLLEDHLVDLLLDVSATGRNRVEREGVSIEHPSRFILVGSGNPEEGELRPQLLDRFGLCTEIHTVDDLDARVEIVARREAFDLDPARFGEGTKREQTRLRRRLMRAQKLFAEVRIARELVRRIAELCLRLRIDGHRGELTITRASRALAAFENRREVSAEDARRVAALALRHRLRRDPLAQTSSGAQIEQAVDELFGSEATPKLEAPKESANEGRERALIDDQTDAHGGREPRRSDLTSDQDERRERQERASDTSGPERRLESADARVNADVSAQQARPLSKPQAQAAPASRHKRGARAMTDARRGRYTRASMSWQDGSRLALDATLRAAAPRQAQRQMSPVGGWQIRADDLRSKRFSRKTGTLFIFAVDASGSMALNRISQAKGALARLLRKSYVNRDRVALVSFRERQATLLLAPSPSSALAKRILDALPIGGATPLCAGLLRALEVAQRAARQGTQRIVLLVFTDGRANVPLDGDADQDRQLARQRIAHEIARVGAALQTAGVRSCVVETQNRFNTTGEGQRLAGALGGDYLHLQNLPEDASRF